MKQFELLGIAIQFMCLASCKEGIIAPRDITVSAFPLNVGSTWTYSISDTSRHYTDTVVVSIISEKTISFSQAIYLWQFHYVARTESLYAVRSGDTVTLAYSLLGIPQRSGIVFRFIFPLTVGKSWSVSQDSDYSVQAGDTLDVPAGSFGRSVLVHSSLAQPNYFEFNSYWIVPDVGICRILQDQYDMLHPPSNAHQTWQLISYSTPT